MTGEGEVDAAVYYSEFMDHTADVYQHLKDALGGSGEKANEDARYVLPNAAETKIMVSMNARGLFHFFSERLCNRAQWEIREIADEMLELAREATPEIFKGIGPKCVQLGYCPEGKMTCGKIKEMKEKYEV